MPYNKSIIVLWFSLAVSLLAGCAGSSNSPVESKASADESYLEHLTPSLFLEELSEALSPGVTLRKTYSKCVQLTKTSEGFDNHTVVHLGNLYC